MNDTSKIHILHNRPLFRKKILWQRIANSNPFFPYLKSINLIGFEQYISYSRRVHRRKLEITRKTLVITSTQKEPLNTVFL